MSQYNAGVGYHPAPDHITPSQAHLISKRFASKSLAIKHFTNTRKIANIAEQLALISALDRLFHSVPRGRGYCLDRQALTNLRAYVQTYAIAKVAKKKELQHG